VVRYLGRPPLREVVMFQDLGHVVASRAMGRLATSALPCAPVLPEPRQGVTRRLLGALAGRRTRA
jgi:hypothetical protein